MPLIRFKQYSLQSGDGETVLDTLLRHGIEVPFSCRSGLCQVCMMRCKEGTVPADAQKDLRANLREQGFFLPCQCVPQENMTISLPDADELFVRATLVDKLQLSPTVTRLRLNTDTTFDYLAGQYVVVRRNDGLMRSYSLASLPGSDDYLELHVKRMPHGKMSNWLIDEFAVGDRIELQGPIGQCFYNVEARQQPILLVGSGTGLAPLAGIVRDAVRQQHAAPVWLYHAARNVTELYLDETMKALDNLLGSFHYRSCITEALTAADREAGRLCEKVFDDHPDLSGWQVFLCGAPVMVKAMQKKCFLAGADMNNIYTDPFETKK